MMPMATEENIADIKDIIIRTQGTMNVLNNRNPNLVLVNRNLQGIRDKAEAMLRKASAKGEEDELVQKIKQVTAKE